MSDLMQFDLGRPVDYQTGVVAPDGYREWLSTYLCWLCDQEAEYAGYCEKHFTEREGQHDAKEDQA